MEQHFQDVAKRVMNDKNLGFFAAHFAKHFTQKQSPQQCRKLMSFGILFYGTPYWLNENLGEIIM